jgi:hypothetical protein
MLFNLIVVIPWYTFYLFIDNVGIGMQSVCSWLVRVSGVTRQICATLRSAKPNSGEVNCLYVLGGLRLSVLAYRQPIPDAERQPRYA